MGQGSVPEVFLLCERFEEDSNARKEKETSVHHG